MPCMAGTDQGDIAKHKHGGRDPPCYLDKAREFLSPMASHKVHRKSAGSSTNRKMGLASSHKSKHNEYLWTLLAAQIDTQDTAN